MVDLKSLRKGQGMMGRTLCEKVGISSSALSMIESGKRRPSVEVAKRIASALGFEWTRFYEDAERETPEQ